MFPLPPEFLFLKPKDKEILNKISLKYQTPNTKLQLYFWNLERETWKL